MTDQPPKPRRRWFQFSLRTLLIAVTLVAGLLVAWRVYVEPYRRQRETVALIKELGGSYTTEPSGPSWLRGLFGDKTFQNIIRISLPGKDRDAEIADLARHLEGLASLRTLDLSLTDVTDAGLAYLNELTILHTLDLSLTDVSDAGLAHLKGLTNLQDLYLSLTDVTNAGVKELQMALPNCKIHH